MEKETVDLSDATAAKPESRSSKRRKPEAIGSLAVEPETSKASRKRRPTIEARSLHAAPPERIGQMLMSAQAKATPEKSPRASLPAGISSQKVETLNRAELMTLSEKIIIDGSSLHQIYETHLVGERGLRRLIAEYLQGGDLKQALRGEVVDRERDFERDPVMREITPELTPAADNLNANQKAALDKLLEQAEVNSAGMSEEVAFFKARAKYEAKELHQHKQRRHALDIGLGALILVLILLVITLLMRRT
ncbi:MAG TPA: hypothetical protein VIJ68_01255 [Candidatus Saccharimonadales bacterium]